MYPEACITERHSRIGEIANGGAAPTLPERGAARGLHRPPATPNGG